MKRKKSELAKQILYFLEEIGEMLPQPFESPYKWVRRAGNIDSNYYWRNVSALKKRKSVEIYKKQNKKFIKITKKGRMEILLWLARQPKPDKWDGKWRVATFDIPESHHHYRDQLRRLLKRNGFKHLQASVYINPYPLNRHAIDYLKTTGLINYIRIMRVDEMDDEKELLNRFKIRRSK